MEGDHPRFTVHLVLSAICCLLVCNVINVLAQELCRTPNNEDGICIPIKQCPPILEALKTRNETSIQFVKKSHCGFQGKQPLVCCGSDIASRDEQISPIEAPTSTTRTSTTITTSTTTTTRRPPPPQPSQAPAPVSGSEAAAGSGSDRGTETPQQTTGSKQLADRSVCGFQVASDRLLGGVKTGLEEFPWMVLLRYVSVKDNSDAGFRCAGTLINKRYVLTAAHCLMGGWSDVLTFTSVRLGEYDIRNDTDCIQRDDLDYEDENCADAVQDIAVEELVPHPFYNPKSGNNDIAMLRLGRDVTFSEYIRPICLPPINLPPPAKGVRMTVAGWGATDNGTETTSPIKLKINVPIVENPECAKILRPHKTRITANHVCAGGQQGIDACKGDSGGPLMTLYSDSNGPQWYQEGVVSRGIGCGTSGLPGVYTRVSRYLQWILNNLVD